MTLPKETIDKIDKESKKYAGLGQDIYRDCATEWAGKASGLIDALVEIIERYPEWHDSVEIAKKALAKYKEVSNDKETT